MLGWKRIFFLVFLFAGLISGMVKAQTDSTQTTVTRTEIQEVPDLKLNQDKKRQRKTEKIAFVSCLFIVLSTIIIYNVRAK